MTIDEYLSQPRKLKAKSERLYKQLLEAEAAMDPRDPLNLGDGIPGRRSGGNGTENRLLNYIDAHKEYENAAKAFIETRNNLNAAIDNLLYWQGCLIYQIYIYNATFDGGDYMKDAGEILRTNNRREILAKIDEAKAALADLLRTQGVEIE